MSETVEPDRFQIHVGDLQIDAVVDPSLPPDRIELRNAEGRVLSAVKISSLDRDPPLTRYVRTMLEKGGATPYAATSPDPVKVDGVWQAQTFPMPPGGITVTREDLGIPREEEVEAKISLTRPVDPEADAPFLDVIAELRARVEAETARFITSAAAANLDVVLDEVLRDAIIVGSGFLRIDFLPTNTLDEPGVGDWKITRLQPTDVELREGS